MPPIGSHQEGPRLLEELRILGSEVQLYISGSQEIVWWFDYAWIMGSGTVRRHGLIGGGVALLEVLLCGWALRLPMLRLPSAEEHLLLDACGRVFLCLLSDQGVELLAPLAPFLHAGCHVSHHDNGLNL